MQNGNVMEYTKSNPGANRLQLVSPPAVFLVPPLWSAAVWGHVRRELPPQPRSYSWRPQRGMLGQPQPRFPYRLSSKQANILVDDDGTALLADFGLATISVDLNTIPLSATAVSSAGTIPWMSPELLLGQGSSPTPQSDSYALGMVIYEVNGLLPLLCPSAHSQLGPDWPPPLPSPLSIRSGDRRTEGEAPKQAS